MIRITVYKDEIVQVKSIPNDERVFNEFKNTAYPWVSEGLTKSTSIEYAADHYTADTVDIIFKTKSISKALLGVMEVYGWIMEHSTSEHRTIKNI